MYRKFTSNVFYYIYKDQNGVDHYISNNSPKFEMNVSIEKLFELTEPIEALGYKDKVKLITDIIMNYPPINRFIIETMISDNVSTDCFLRDDKLILDDYSHDYFHIELPLIDLNYIKLINGDLINQKLHLDTSIENKVDAIAKLLKVDFIDMDDEEPNMFHIGFEKYSGYPSITIYPTRLEVYSDCDDEPYTFLKFTKRIPVKGKSKEYLIDKLYDIIRNEDFIVMNNYKLEGYL